MSVVIGAGPAGPSPQLHYWRRKGARCWCWRKRNFRATMWASRSCRFAGTPFERLGVLEEMERLAFVKKHSVQFVRAGRAAVRAFLFLPASRITLSSTTWQVERADFDLMLMENARGKGAEVREQYAVRGVLKDDSGRTIGVEAAWTGRRSPSTFSPK